MRSILIPLSVILPLTFLNAQLCPKPKVHMNLRMFVDPNGVIARNLRGGEAEIQKTLTILRKRINKNLKDEGIEVVGFTTKNIPMDEYIKLTGEGDANAERFINTLDIPQEAEYLFDIVIGESINGLNAYGFIINVKSRKIYKVVRVSMPLKKAKLYVVAAVIKLTDRLFESYKSQEGEAFISTVINKTETVRSINVSVNPPKPHLRNTAFARVRILKAENEYGDNIFNFLGTRTGFALKVDKGKVVNGEKLEGGYQYIRSDAPEFIVQLPSCEEFDNTGRMNIALQFAYLCPRADMILSTIQQSNLKEFTAEAPLAWQVREVWNIDAPNAKTSFSVEYQLHFKANCEDKLRRTVYFEGMKVPKADWISDNFIHDQPINKPKVSVAKYSDCGVLDPWTTQDKEIDEFRVVGFDNKAEGFTELGYHLKGLEFVNSIGESQDFFEMTSLAVIGERVVFGDYDVYVRSMVSLPMDKMRAFKPFSYQQILTGTIPNTGCGDEPVTIQITYEFQPKVDCYCAKVVKDIEETDR